MEKKNKTFSIWFRKKKIIGTHKFPTKCPFKWTSIYWFLLTSDDGMPTAFIHTNYFSFFFILFISFDFVVNFMCFFLFCFGFWIKSISFNLSLICFACYTASAWHAKKTSTSLSFCLMRMWWQHRLNMRFISFLFFNFKSIKYVTHVSVCSAPASSHDFIMINIQNFFKIHFFSISNYFAIIFFNINFF